MNAAPEMVWWVGHRESLASWGGQNEARHVGVGNLRLEDFHFRSLTIDDEL
jgi:hypothetical protein